MKLTNIQKGYIAGIIDGEGTIGLYKSHNKISPRIQIGLTNYEALVSISALIGGNIQKRKKYYETDTQIWVYSMPVSSIREILSVIEPHLIVKKTQAQLMIVYLSYFKAEDRYSCMGLKMAIKDKFHQLFRVLNSRGNRKRGEFKETLTQATLSQVLEEIQGKVHRLHSDAKEIKKEKILSTLKENNKMGRYSLISNHYWHHSNNFENMESQFNEIIDELIEAKKVISKKIGNGITYFYADNECTSAPAERYDIVRTAQRCAEVKDKEPLR